MKKEFVWAIGIGVFFGLILAFGLWRINTILKSNSKVVSEVKGSPSPKAETPNQIKIAINKPENGDVVSEDIIKVSGISKSNSTIIISGQESDYILSTDQNGLFEKDIDLTSGINQIVASNLEDTQKVNSNIIVIYSSSFEPKTASSEATIQEKVDEQIKNIINKPKSFIGTVTDVTETSLQLRSDKNEIEQVSIASDTTNVVNTKEKTSKIAKISDIAIGDFIAALGYINSSSVLSASRILITNPITEPKIKITSGTYKKGELKTDKNTLYYEFKDGQVTKIKSTSLKEDMEIIYVEKDDQIRTVFLLQDVLN